MSKLNIEEVVSLLKLEPLPDEGGFYREIFRSDLKIEYSEKAAKHKRHAMTSIYYLITDENFSALHRLKQDEIFHFYMGDPAAMVQITKEGKLIEIKLGRRIELGENPQIVVPAGYWQGIKVAKGGSWSLLGTTVAPGFESDDFELGDRQKLVKKFPEHESIIRNYTNDR